MRNLVIVAVLAAVGVPAPVGAQEPSDLQPAIIAEALAELHRLGVELEAINTLSVEENALGVGRVASTEPVAVEPVTVAVGLAPVTETQLQQALVDRYRAIIDSAVDLLRTLDVRDAGVSVAGFSVSLPGFSVDFRLEDPPPSQP